MTLLAGGPRIPLTAVFVLATGFCVWRCVSSTRRSPLADRTSYGLHALMCASMAVMVWSPPPLAVWQMALFLVAAGWFAVRATGVTLASLRVRPTGAAGSQRPATGSCSAHEGRSGRTRCLHHAIVMALMAWMIGATSTWAGMAGMAMSRAATGPALVGGAYCLASGVLLVAVGGRGAASGGFVRPGVRDDVVHGVMTAGMAVMLLAMV